MKRRLAQLARLVPVVAAMALFVLTLRSADLGRALSLIRALGPALPLLLLPHIAAVALDAFGWQLAFHGLSRFVRLRLLVAVRLAADAVFMSLPSGAVIAEALQPYLLRRRAQLPFEEAVVGTVARKIFIILSQGLFLVVSSVVAYPALQSASQKAIGRAGLPALLLFSGGVLVAIATVLCAIFFYGKVAQRSRRALERLGLSWLRPWLERNAHRFGLADDYLARYLASGPARLLTPLPVFLAMWLMKAFETWLFLRLLGSPITLGAAMALETTIILVRVLVVPVPGGLGVQDLGYVLFMRAFAVADASTVGTALALMKRGKELFWTAIGLAIFVSTKRRGPLATEPDATEPMPGPLRSAADRNA
jgi:Lysylphosphatidylglycerol synthase TM region